jgi:hypothetical protein
MYQYQDSFSPFFSGGLPGDEFLVAALANALQLGESVKRSFRRCLPAEPVLVKRLKGAAQITPVPATSPLPAQARSGVALGFVLLGDAAGFLDRSRSENRWSALPTVQLEQKFQLEQQ